MHECDCACDLCSQVHLSGVLRDVGREKEGEEMLKHVIEEAIKVRMQTHIQTQCL